MRRRKNIPNTAIRCDKSQFVEKELQDKIELWMLRIIINLRGQFNNIDLGSFYKRVELQNNLRK